MEFPRGKLGVSGGFESRLSCKGCLQEFTEDGDHCPRLLPCTHPLCHSCLATLIPGSQLECPECGEKHEVREEEKSFPPHKEIFTQIKRKTSKVEPIVHEFQKCEIHGNTVNMFCKEPGCNKPICRTCLVEQHKDHDFTKMEEPEKESLMREVVKIKANFETKVKILSDAKKDIEEKTAAVLEDIKKRREEINRYFDKMIVETEGKKKLSDVQIDNEVSAINSNIEPLSSIYENMVLEKNISYEKIMENRETLKWVSEHNVKDFSGERSFSYPDFVVDRSSVQELSGESFAEEGLGSVVRRKLSVLLPRPVNCSGTFYVLYVILSRLKCKSRMADTNIL